MAEVPDGWENYTPIGKQIQGTKFITFKVPLKKEVCGSVSSDKQLYPNKLLNSIPNLGLIIDLTNTTKYYNPEVFKKFGIDYIKIACPGREIPTEDLRQKFDDFVQQFWNKNKYNNKLIGVHCTHGVNRTGYLVCAYMVTNMKMNPLDAIKRFEKARGHEIERENYRKEIINLKTNKVAGLDSNDKEKEKKGKFKYSRYFDEHIDDKHYHDEIKYDLNDHYNNDKYFDLKYKKRERSISRDNNINRIDNRRYFNRQQNGINDNDYGNYKEDVYNWRNRGEVDIQRSVFKRKWNEYDNKRNFRFDNTATQNYRRDDYEDHYRGRHYYHNKNVESDLNKPRNYYDKSRYEYNSNVTGARTPPMKRDDYYKFPMRNSEGNKSRYDSKFNIKSRNNNERINNYQHLHSHRYNNLDNNDNKYFSQKYSPFGRFEENKYRNTEMNNYKYVNRPNRSGKRFNPFHKPSTAVSQERSYENWRNPPENLRRFKNNTRSDTRGSSSSIASSSFYRNNKSHY